MLLVRTAITHNYHILSNPITDACDVGSDNVGHKTAHNDRYDKEGLNIKVATTTKRARVRGQERETERETESVLCNVVIIGGWHLDLASFFLFSL